MRTSVKVKSMWFFNANLHLLQLRYFNLIAWGGFQALATAVAQRVPKGAFPKRVALPRRRPWVAATTPKSWRKQTTALLSANLPKRIAHAHFFCLKPSDFWISRQRQGRIEVFPQTRRSTEQHTVFSLMWSQNSEIHQSLFPTT